MSGYKRANTLACIAELDESSPTKCEQEDGTTVSPITGIVRGLMNSTLSSQDRWKRKHGETNGDPDSSERGRSSYGNCEGLFKNAFKIKNTPENSVRSRPKARRLLGMTSRRSSSFEPASPSIDKENNSVVCSPQKIVGAKRSRHPLEDCDPNSQDSGYEASYPEKEEKPRRDGFRFAEPLAVAPRRLSIECRSPMASPVRSSPQRARVARPSLFRSLSSGYESMDDGFNDLMDSENMDDATQLPNGISTLLCGDIVSADANADTDTDIDVDVDVDGDGDVYCDIDVGSGSETTAKEAKPASSNPSTPEFCRTDRAAGNFRRSVSLQSERQESRNSSSSSLSKIRSCLFRSPNASSSTASLGFEDSSPLATTIPVTRRRRIVSDFSLPDQTSSVRLAVHSPLSVRTFKRPEPPIDDSPVLVKKCRTSNHFFDTFRDNQTSETMPSSSPICMPLQRSLSESATTTLASMMTSMDTEMEREREREAKSEMTMQSELETHVHIKSAIHRSTTNTDLTGDFSKPCVLPLASGHHEDLKSISVDTLAGLISGEFNDKIGSFKIVDCRYPYEFDAGHIQGALNLYSKDLIEQILLDPLTNTPEIQPDTSKRNILVFHCEFSWERGPNLSRFLRSLDRQRNKEHYPALHYPEVYLLHGGYEQFFRQQKPLCSPQGYRPMRHPDHEADLRQFRSKSKSWQGEKSRISGCVTRTNLKRLGF